jgi:nucleoside-diphosphate-sugar epimerase
VNYLPGRDWERSRKRDGCTKKSKDQLGFQANTSLKDGLKKIIEWTKTRLGFIEKTICKHERFVSFL